jgi:rhodanese-related sulfurtransferase
MIAAGGGGPVSGSVSVPVLDREQLRPKLAAGQPFKLVMVASDFGFRAKHIPGSLHAKTHGETFASLGKDEEIVVYCSNLDCHASQGAIKKLLELGYRRVSHYPGGLIDWEAAGLPVEGDWAADH